MPNLGFIAGVDAKTREKEATDSGQKKKKSPIHEIRVGVHLDECNGRG